MGVGSWEDQIKYSVSKHSGESPVHSECSVKAAFYGSFCFLLSLCPCFLFSPVVFPLPFLVACFSFAHKGFSLVSWYLVPISSLTRLDFEPLAAQHSPRLSLYSQLKRKGSFDFETTCWDRGLRSGRPRFQTWPRHWPTLWPQVMIIWS